MYGTSRQAEHRQSKAESQGDVPNKQRERTSTFLKFDATIPDASDLTEVISQLLNSAEVLVPKPALSMEYDRNKTKFY